MIDRIEELLSVMAAEDDEEEREDGSAQKRGAVVSSGLRSERSKSGEAPRDRTAFAQSESLARAANRRSVTAGELREDGPVWTVSGGPRSMDEAQRAASAGRTAQTEEILPLPRDSGLNLTPEGAERFGTGQAGLEGLYRQTVRGLRPAAPALPPEQAERTTRDQEPENAASLTVDELDRAVRRDSRRYDGGMSIY